MKAGAMDAALDGHGPYEGKCYFFKGDGYVRYDLAADRVDPGFPAPLSAWNLPADFAAGVDAALDGDGPYAGKAYFFKGARYVRYDWAAGRCDPGYPAAISAWNLPGAFASGVDACWAGRAPHAGKAYFIKGGEYARYDWASDRCDPGYPKPLSARGLPAPLSSGASAAANGRAGKAYFFGAGPDRRTDLYARYDWARGTADAGYPKPAAGAWPGLVEMLRVAPAKAMALRWHDAATRGLAGYAAALAAGVSDPAAAAPVEQALATHFRLDRARFPAFAPTIIGNYAKVRAALADGAGVMRFRTDAEARDDGGADASGEPYPCYTFHGSSINVTSTFARFGPLCQAAMVLHEPVHYVDAQADINNDFYEHGSAYATMTADQAVHNPSSYVCFAEHLFYGSDERHGAGRPDE